MRSLVKGLAVRETRRFEVLVPLHKPPPTPPPPSQWVYDELTWVIKIPQERSPIMLLPFLLSPKNGSGGLAGMKG